MRSFEFRRGSQHCRIDAVGNGRSPDRGFHFIEQLRHGAFKMEPVVENNIGALHFGYVAGAGLVQVGINSGAHQTFHFDPVSPDIGGKVGDHAGGCYDFDFAGTGLLIVTAGNKNYECD